RWYGAPQPPVDPDAEFAQTGDPRYADLPPELMPATECLEDVLHRFLPYWYDAIVPDLRTGVTVAVVAHGNSLRALVKHLDDISDDDISGLNIPTGVPLLYELDESMRPVRRGGEYLDPSGVPLLYELDESMRPVRRGGEYLDPDAAAAAIEAVKNQGR